MVKALCISGSGGGRAESGNVLLFDSWSDFPGGRTLSNTAAYYVITTL